MILVRNIFCFLFVRMHNVVLIIVLVIRAQMCDKFKQTAHNLSNHRCTNVGYMMNGLAIQLLASLGYEHFKAFIEFIEILLKTGRNLNKNNTRLRQRNEILSNKCKKFGNNIQRKNKKIQVFSRSSEYRVLKKIDKNFEQHARDIHKTPDTLMDLWISHKCRTDPFMFIHNKELALKKQREFNHKQKELWNDFKNNKQRICKLTMNYINRRHSMRDIQCHREAVIFIFSVIYHLENILDFE